jgi:hypothetical protein
MRRKRSAPSLKSDSATEDFLDLETYNNDEESSIFMADATSSGNTSDLEKESTSTPEDTTEVYEEGDEMTEETSLLGQSGQSGQSGRDRYGGISKQGKEDYASQSVPNVIYASPARPHLPSPSTSNPLAPGMSMYGILMIVTPGIYLPYNWRTPAMVPYDVQAHPFNRAPSATPQMTAGQGRYLQGSVSDVTAASSRSSVWSVEMEHGSCGCLSGY